MGDGAGLSRRRFLGIAGLLGAGVGAGALSGAAGYVVDRALESDPAGAGSLADVDHIVLLMQENRSFDHYFGTMSGVRGFDDMGRHLAQSGYQPGVGVDPAGALLPFRLDTRRRSDLDADILNDPAHSWTVQHSSWNHGAMDAWVSTHLATDGPELAPEVMGYYTRTDLPMHYLLADAFTVCDHYFSSVIGPTAPNRMYWMTGMLDPDGVGGGPVLSHSKHIPDGKLTWRTFPENLLDAGVSWKVYNSHSLSTRSELSGMLRYFRAYQNPESELYGRGIAPRFPSDFADDVADGTLPAVSWLIPSMGHSEHPSYPPAPGAEGIVQVLDILTSNRDLWERTALVVSYDENGGFFDHVAPPVPIVHTAGEFVLDEPIGLGFRVPCLVLSPYSRGGYVCSDILDHTSQLRMIEERFDVPVPNLTPWRRAIVGDLTRTVQTQSRIDPFHVGDVGLVAAAHEAAVGDAAEIKQALGGRATPYPVPATNSMPRQERSPARRQLGT